MNWIDLARELTKSRGVDTLVYPSQFLYSDRGRKKNTIFRRKLVVFHGILTTGRLMPHANLGVMHLTGNVMRARKPKKIYYGTTFPLYYRSWE